MVTKSKIAIIAAFFFAFSTEIKAEPSMAETIQFIESKITDDAGNSASCEKIVFVMTTESYVNSYSNRTRLIKSTITIPTRLVSMSVDGSEEYIFFECVSGKCIRDDEGSPSSKATVRTGPIARRVISAIRHLQKLCGGAQKTPF